MRRWVLAIGVLVAYNSWVWAPLLNPNPRALGGYLSELAAGDQPYHWFFRGGDLLAAGLVAVIAWLGWRAWDACLGRWKRWLVIFLSLIAAATVVDVIFAMPCAPSFDAVCRSAERANPFAVNTVVHAAASSLVGLGLVASFVAAFLGIRASGDLARARVVGVVGSVMVVLLAGTVVLAGSVGFGHGFVQAGQVLLAGLWLAWLALQLRPGRWESLDG